MQCVVGLNPILRQRMSAAKNLSAMIKQASYVFAYGVLFRRKEYLSV